MTLKELKDRINAVPQGEFHNELNVCIPNNKGSIGPTSTTDVKHAGQGIDWDNKKFMIWPETEMIEMVGNPNDYVGFVNYLRRETGMGKEQTLLALEQCKEEIGTIISNWYRSNGKKTS